MLLVVVHLPVAAVAVEIQLAHLRVALAVQELSSSNGHK
jgi:hypothetical protein